MGLKEFTYEEKLTGLTLYILDERRLRCDLIETFKMLTGKENINSDRFLILI